MSPRAINLRMNQQPSTTFRRCCQTASEIEMNERMNESEKRAKSETLNTKKVIIFGDDKFLCAIDGFMMETNYVIDSRDLPTDVVWLWI